jgi:hypothetical protein
MMTGKLFIPGRASIISSLVLPGDAVIYVLEISFAAWDI